MMSSNSPISFCLTRRKICRSSDFKLDELFRERVFETGSGARKNRLLEAIGDGDHKNCISCTGSAPEKEYSLILLQEFSFHASMTII